MLSRLHLSIFNARKQPRGVWAWRLFPYTTSNCDTCAWNRQRNRPNWNYYTTIYICMSHLCSVRSFPKFWPSYASGEPLSSLRGGFMSEKPLFLGRDNFRERYLDCQSLRRNRKILSYKRSSIRSQQMNNVFFSFCFRSLLSAIEFYSEASLLGTTRVFQSGDQINWP